MLIVAGGYMLARANAVLQAGQADFVAFGQLFVANTDQVERFRHATERYSGHPELDATQGV